MERYEINGTVENTGFIMMGMEGLKIKFIQDILQFHNAFLDYRVMCFCKVTVGCFSADQYGVDVRILSPFKDNAFPNGSKRAYWNGILEDFAMYMILRQHLYVVWG